eukprot:UN05305
MIMIENVFCVNVRVVTHDLGVCFEDFPGEFIRADKCHESGMDISVCERDDPEEEIEATVLATMP